MLSSVTKVGPTPSTLICSCDQGASKAAACCDARVRTTWRTLDTRLPSGSTNRQRVSANTETRRTSGHGPLCEETHLSTTGKSMLPPATEICRAQNSHAHPAMPRTPPPRARVTEQNASVFSDWSTAATARRQACKYASVDDVIIADVATFRVPAQIASEMDGERLSVRCEADGGEADHHAGHIVFRGIVLPRAAAREAGCVVSCGGIMVWLPRACADNGARVKVVVRTVGSKTALSS